MSCSATCLLAHVLSHHASLCAGAAVQGAQRSDVCLRGGRLRSVQQAGCRSLLGALLHGKLQLCISLAAMPDSQARQHRLLWQVHNTLFQLCGTQFMYGPAFDHEEDTSLEVPTQEGGWLHMAATADIIVRTYPAVLHVPCHPVRLCCR